MIYTSRKKLEKMIEDMVVKRTDILEKQIGYFIERHEEKQRRMMKSVSEDSKARADWRREDSVARDKHHDLIMAALDNMRFKDV